VSGLAVLTVASAAFVGTHFLMSHPLRASMVGALGERGFASAYSIVSLILFGAMVYFYPSASREAGPLWTAGNALWAVASLLMCLGTILFVGSLRRNPALPRPGKRIERIDDPTGVFAITRHPMMWGFALWGLVHILVHPTPADWMLGGSFIVLALGGSVAQDRKKERLMGDVWREWEAKTPFLPFGRGFALPDAFSFVVGTILFLAATWWHQPAGPWRWIG